jgi:predicted nucleic acid-binding Zn ribbon protein
MTPNHIGDRRPAIASPRSRGDLKPLGHAVPTVLDAILCSAPLSDGKVTFAWSVAVGPAVVRATTVKLDRGVLLVDTASPQWAREIRRSSYMILKRLKLYLGDALVERIEVRSA